jgi:hypothetical protein
MVKVEPVFGACASAFAGSIKRAVKAVAVNTVAITALINFMGFPRVSLLSFPAPGSAY